jgi:hypothetical protein
MLVVMPPQGDPAAYALAYEAGLKAVDEQSSTLRETRDRAGALLSSAAVTAGLVTGLAFRADLTARVNAFGVVGAVIAVLGFVGVTATTTMIWRPAGGRFVHDAGVIIGSYVEGDPPLELAGVHRELALWLGQQAESNRAMLELKLTTFTWGLIALVLEIGGSILVLGVAVNG